MPCVYYSLLYRALTAPTEIRYLEIAGHRFGRDPLAGGIILGMTLLGIIAVIREITVAERVIRRRLLLFLSAFIAIAFVLIAMVPLPWQRYSLPLIPFISIFFGIGIAWGIKNSRRILSHGRLSDRLSEILAQFSPDSWMS